MPNLNVEFDDVQIDVTFTQASQRSNITSAENIALSFGKLSKWYEALVPTGGSNGQILGWNSSGTAKWITNPSSVTTTGDGNAITSLTFSNGSFLADKGSTFLTQHPTITLSADTTTTPAQMSHGDTFTAVTSVTREGNGHVTKINTATYTLPDQYMHPDGFPEKTTAGFYKYTVNANGHVTAGDAITKTDIGLGNVENKSSATIRGELTKANVTTALGYTPPESDTNTTYTLTQDATDGHILTFTPSSGTATTITIPDNDTKVTSSTNHYTPATASGQDKSASASGATAAWSIDVVKGITLNTDGKGHVTGLTVTSGKIPGNPVPSNNVTGSGTSGYLTKWNGTNTITNGPQLGSSTTTFLRNDGSWAAPENTDTKVTQTAVGDTYTNFRPLVISASNSSAKPPTASTVTDGTFITSGIFCQPSASTIYAAYYKTTATARGYFLVDSSATEYPGIYDNGSNLWIGSLAGASKHHIGATYISAGHNGTAGYSTIYVAVPNAGNTDSTSYPVIHSGNYTDYTVTKTGGGASGTWGISITGNATTATTASKLGSSTLGSVRRPIYLNTGTATEANYMVSHFGNAGKSNMNDIGRLHASSGMTNLSDPSNTTDNPLNGTTKSTGWHLYWSTNYTDDPSGSNAWVAQIANKAGTAQWWVRSRQGGTITNGTAWAAGWEHLVVAPQAGQGGTTTPIYVDTNGHVQSIGYTIATNVPSNALFTDSNVRQSATTTTDYRPIVTGAKNTTTIANLDDEITSSVYTSENFFVQPSTGSLYATQFFTKSYLSGTGINVTSNGIYARSYFKRADNTVADYKEYLIRTYNGKINSNDGILVSVGGGGLTIVGGGESSSALAGLISDDQTKSDKTTLNVGGTLNTAIAGNSEQLIMSSDGNIYFLTNCQTIANRKPVCLDASSYFYPGTTNTGSIGTSSYKWASMYATTFYGALSGNASSSNYNVMQGITIKTGSSNQSHITLQTLMTWLITTKAYINSNTAQSLSIYTSWSYAENDILQLVIAGTNYELQLAGVIIEFDGYASDYQTGTFRLRIHSSPTISFTAASGYTQFPTSHIAEYTCNGSGYSPTWKMITDLGDTIAIAHGGTGATTRLNALKNLTNENVGTSATYFLTITNSWGKGGYSSVADVKSVLGLSVAVNSGTANQLAYYSGANAINSTAKITYVQANNAASTPALKSGLHIESATYGNTAANMLGGVAGVFQYGDGGPQVSFKDANSNQAGALIFTADDAAATGTSWHFVSTETDWNVTSKRFHAKTSISIGTDKPSTSYNLYVNGTTNITGNTTIGGTLGVTGAITQNGNQVLHAGNYTSYTYSATASRTANTVLAAPNGSAGAATFRKLVAADIPTLNYMGVKSDGTYYGMASPTGADNIWIRTTSLGIIPYQSGNAGSGHSSLGTSSWYFSSAFIDTIHGTLDGTASQAVKLRSSAARTDSTVDTADTTPYQKYWVKIASSYTTGSYIDLESLWAVNDVYGNRQGILKVRARVDGTAGTFGSTRTIRWLVADSSIDVNRFAIVCYNNRKPDGTTASGTATVELWWKSTGQYASFSFVLLDETRRTGKQPNDWVLYDTSTYGQAALPTTGNITYSVAATILNSTAGNAATATSAAKLSNTAAIGSSTQPVYFSANGVPVACTQDANGAHFSTVPFVRNDGVMEVGRYFDMHSTNAGTTDYDVRLDTSGVSSFRFIFNTPASSSVAPSTNNQTSLGTSSLKWSNVYATTFTGALSGNADTATTATKLGTANKGSATKGIYLNAGSPTEMTYSLSSTVNAGTANQLAYYSGANAISATHNGTNTGDSLYFKTGTNAKSARQTILGIYGQTYGNTASELISGTAGVLSYGDGGPQIDFNSSASGSQAGALIFTDHDSAAAGASWHFVSNQTDWNVTSKRFHARTSISIGENTPNTSYNLYVKGTTGVTGVITSTYKSTTYVTSLTSSVITLSDTASSFGGWICGPTKNGRIVISSYQGNDDKLYFGYGERGRTTNSYVKAMTWDGPTNTLTATKFVGALQGNADTATSATSAVNANNATNATYADQINTTVTDGTTTQAGYGILFAQDPSASEYNGVKKTNNVRINLKAAAAGSEGLTELVLGNNKAISAANNESGLISLYSAGGSYHQIKTNSVTSATTHMLPTKGGTLFNTGNLGIVTKAVVLGQLGFSRSNSGLYYSGSVDVSDLVTKIFAVSIYDFSSVKNISVQIHALDDTHLWVLVADATQSASTITVGGTLNCRIFGILK